MNLLYFGFEGAPSNLGLVIIAKPGRAGHVDFEHLIELALELSKQSAADVEAALAFKIKK